MDTSAKTKPGARSKGSKPASSAAKTAPNIVGLMGWAKVTTHFGSVPVSLLRPADHVLSAQNQPIEVKQVIPIALDPEFLQYHPDARPVLIPKGAIGRGLPTAEIAVAPDQAVEICHRGRKRLVRAKHLVGRRGIDWANVDDVVIYRIQTEIPADLLCEGLRFKA
jgi:hypothetical protein